MNGAQFWTRIIPRSVLWIIRSLWLNLSLHWWYSDAWLELNSGGAFAQPEYLTTFICVARDSSRISDKSEQLWGGSIHFPNSRLLKSKTRKSLRYQEGIHRQLMGLCIGIDDEPMNHSLPLFSVFFGQLAKKWKIFTGSRNFYQVIGKVGNVNWNHSENRSVLHKKRWKISINLFNDTKAHVFSEQGFLQVTGRRCGRLGSTSVFMGHQNILKISYGMKQYVYKLATSNLE